MVTLQRLQRALPLPLHRTEIQCPRVQSLRLPCFNVPACSTFEFPHYEFIDACGTNRSDIQMRLPYLKMAKS